MLESIIKIVVWFFVAWYLMKLIVGFVYALRSKYPRQIMREFRDDVFVIILHSLLLVCLLIYNLGVI